ncbi:MAG: FtsX-like permease family protein [Candidatus Saccharimonadales bacterium]
MRIWDIILTANSNLAKSKLRTFLTISAVFIGGLTLMLTNGVGAGLKTYVDKQVDAVGAKDVLLISAKSQTNENPIANAEPTEYNPGARPTGQFGQALLTSEDLATIKSEPGIKSVVPLYNIQAEYMTTGDKKWNTTVMQTTEGVNYPVSSGRRVNVTGKEREVTIPTEYVSALGFESPEDALNKKLTFGFKNALGKLFTLDATIVGIQETSIINGSQVTSNISFAKQANDAMTQGIPEFQKDQYMIAFAKFDNSFTDQQINDLKANLSKKGFDAKTLDDQLGIITSIISAITTFLNIFAGIALVAATFGIVNTLMMAVAERTKEIGLMKALGMRKLKIFALFSFEAILIGFWGALVALGVANIVGRIGSSIASETLFKDFDGLSLFSFPALPMIGIILVIVAISFVAGTLPARRASKLDPIEALRYE